MKLSTGHQPIPEDDLPKGWVASRIGDVCTTVQGGRIGLTKGDNYRSSGFPAYSAAGQDGFVDISEFAQEGVVLSAIGANCGRCFYASGQWTTLANVQAILPDANRLSARFLFHRANMDGFWPRSGSAQPFIKPSDVHKCWVAHPREVAEQTRIALVLDTVDEAIAKTEAVIAKLRQVRAGLLHDLLTRGLDKNGQLRDPIAHPEQFQPSPLGRIPKEWRIKPFTETVAETSLGTTVRGTSGGKRTIPLLKMGNLLWGELSLGAVEELDVDRIPDLEQLRLRYRDFLFNTRNTPELVGKTAVWRNELPEATHDNNLLRVRFKADVMSPFVCLWMSNGIGKNMVFTLATATTSVAAIYWRNLAIYPLPVPSPEEQEAIVTKVEAQDALIAQEVLGLKKLHHLKSGLMTDLLTGRVRVPELDLANPKQ